MGLFKKTARKRKARIDATQARRAIHRRCQFEKMEPRQLLDADPVIAGITYLEDDLGQDSTPDYFEVTFDGGAATTQLTQFVINGDQDLSGGISQGDMFFDIDSSSPGAGQFHGFQFHAAGSRGITENDIMGVSISPDGLQMTVNVANFQAGDILAFTIDVDEVETLRDDKIASGVEFEGTHFTATFVDENYNFAELDISLPVTLSGGQMQSQSQGTFYDEYDSLFGNAEDLSNGELDLIRDNQEGNGNRTAGAIDAYQLQPKPVVISGTVYHDENLNCEQDGNELGIAGVNITLQMLNQQTGQYQSVAETQTDAQGNYQFGTDLGLMPGTYRLVEAQPAGYLDVGASAGQVSGVDRGVVAEDVDGYKNVIADIQIPLGGTVAENYDFKEVRPASIEGTVWHDRNDDGIRNTGEEGIANVLIQVTRVGAKDASIDDPFAGSDPIFVRTDANGNYQVTALPPGIYEITEINNYPPGSNPLAGFIDGKDSLGTIQGIAKGTSGNDQFTGIELCAGDEAREFNFGELKPATISGFVSVATPEGACLDPLDPQHEGIAGVAIQLFDLNGNLVASTVTNAQGYYQFGALTPGVYSIVEVQPEGFLDGADRVGGFGGQAIGLNPVNDRFAGIEVKSGQSASMYNFCEHRPASVMGTVWHDLNNDGNLDNNEPGIRGVTIQLLDASGNILSETQTDTAGQYQFDNLYAGQYSIRELQPQDYLDGQESIGSVQGRPSGQTTADEFRAVGLLEGVRGVNYNFGEIRAASIAGTVHADVNGDCTFDPELGDRPLSGVLLELLDSNGQVIASTTTNAGGDYSFENLLPGTYSVREYTPPGYLNGESIIGVVNGQLTGQSSADLLTGILLQSGQQAVNYDFCEHVPAELRGSVWHDLNNDGQQQPGEPGIGGVTIQLWDASGNLMAQQVTDSAGNYRFADLLAGEYQLREIQPLDYVDGREAIGSIDGQVVGNHSANDEYSKIIIQGGQVGVDYDFGEIRLATIDGFVHLDPDGDCQFDLTQGDTPLAGVTLQLLSPSGNVLAETVTDDGGYYVFADLLPGEYSIRQIQPAALFTAGQTVGSGGGQAAENQISGILVASGQHVENYNFCEQQGAEISGRVWEDGPAFESDNGTLPDGYRDLRDGLYNPGVDTPIAGVRMELWYYIDPTSGSVNPRPVTLGELLGDGYSHLGNDLATPVWVTTDAAGEYQFTGLPAGNYIVLQSQPEGYVDANDTPGTTTGFVFNSESQAATQSLLLTKFSNSQLMDAVVNIRVNAGEYSWHNNFSEVRAVPEGLPITPFSDPVPRIPIPVPPASPLNPGWGLAGHVAVSFTSIIGGGRGVALETLPNADPYSWHLSVVNAGEPRGGDVDGTQPTWLQTGFLSQQDWNRFDMSAGEWTFTSRQVDGSYVVNEDSTYYGMIDGIPLAGDFDGDGDDEMVLYKDGFWMIDLNGNGQWDIDDLMARLGNGDDQPVVGDWDGDGKDDIGIYGPAWEGDREAIESEPGVPDLANDTLTRPKNVPPQVADAAGGARAMRLTSFGSSRVDVIDHVFGYGEGQDLPVTGDWNGDSIRTIGLFRDGHWHIDLTGDGRFDFEDADFTFGQAGDIPLVGDFDGDGVEEIAVYRDGTWIIDTNGNRQRDAADQVFELGGRGDTPVVGDWDGDGRDEPAIHTNKK